MNILTKKHLDIELSSKTVLAGQFRLVVRGADGEVRRDTGWFDNIILDSGLNRWGSGAVRGGAAIGTGTSTPTAIQTGLDAQAAWTTTQQIQTSGNSGSAPYFGTLSQTYRFAIGALNGNYTEVGIGWASGANMFSRALIVDALGNPTTVSVTSAEQLDVSYTLRAYVPTVDVTSTATIGGVSTNVTTRAALGTAAGWGAGMADNKNGPPNNTYFLAFNGALGSITSDPSGTQSSASSGTSAAYVNNSLTVVYTGTWGLTSGNLAGGITAIRTLFYTGPYFQFGFSPAIAKDATKTLALSMSHTWARRP